MKHTALTVLPDEAHEFTVRYLDGEVIANVWHSDLNEWTVETPDGPVYREVSRAAAIARCEQLAA